VILGIDAKSRAVLYVRFKEFPAWHAQTGYWAAEFVSRFNRQIECQAPDPANAGQWGRRPGHRAE